MKGIRIYRILSFALLIVISGSATKLAYAQTYTVLYDFGSKTGDPVVPAGILAQGRDGALYETSDEGGVNGAGTLFKYSSAEKMRVLYSFCSQPSCADGIDPEGGLTLRPDGDFIGTARFGGSKNSGTIFNTTESGTLTILYTFTGDEQFAIGILAHILSEKIEALPHVRDDLRPRRQFQPSFAQKLLDEGLDFPFQ